MGCKECGSRLGVGGGRGRSPLYCSSACRQKAYRKRNRKMAFSPCFPAEMLSASRWVRAVGKRPVMPNGAPASSTDSSTWCSFSEVQSGAGDGFGFMLGDRFGCIDIDHCINDGTVSDLASIVLAANRDAFVERSVSGSGLHIFGWLKPGKGKKFGNGVEVYSRDRFIRVTGDGFSDGTMSMLSVPEMRVSQRREVEV